MEAKKKRRIGREDWIDGAIELMRERGVGGVKVTVLAERLGVTSGSFYWHFSKLDDLLAAILDYWENRLTVGIVEEARAFSGPATERIRMLMHRVIHDGAAEADNAISVWARTSPDVRAVYERTIQQRFDFAAWMFGQAGFDDRQATARGRLFVAYLMGESTAGLRHHPDCDDILQRQFEILVAPAHAG